MRLLITILAATCILFTECTKTQFPEKNNIPLGFPLPTSPEIGLIMDTVEQVPVLVIGSPGMNFIVSFLNDLGAGAKTLEPVQNALPVILQDSSGNRWDISGQVVEGPLEGTQLTPTQSFIGYWFSWGAFFPGADIYNKPHEPGQSVRPYLTGNWLIPESEVKNGGPGKDGIPALVNPEMLDFSNTTYLDEEDLVLGLILNGEARAYPHKILDWHEIINDGLQGNSLVITYCPLTGTGIGRSQTPSSSDVTFGVSGKLYNSNLIPYDRKTDSYWSQIRLDCIHGERKGEKLETFQLIETTWQTWSAMYPRTKVVSTNTGYSRNYDVYPYGNYKTDPGLYFPVSINDNRLHPKERVHGIIFNDKAKVYRFENFE